MGYFKKYLAINITLAAKNIFIYKILIFINISYIKLKIFNNLAPLKKQNLV